MPTYQRLREFARHLMTEGLSPAGAAGAVFVGVFVAFVPIYGLQSIVAIAVATGLRLNKPLTFGATFVNNPLLQPFLVVGSIGVGHRVVHRRWTTFSPTVLASINLRDEFVSWLIGSVILGAAVGAVCAGLTFGIVAWRASRRQPTRLAQMRADVTRRFRGLRSRDRNFVAWKLRLDRLFEILMEEDLGTGTVVDLGCGYGEALALVAFRDRGRGMYGCDLDRNRIEAARHACADLQVRFEVADVRVVEPPRAGLVLLIDILQYLDAAEQTALLARCAAALDAGGGLIMRIQDLDRGWMARLTTTWDWLIFRAGGFRQRPFHLPVASYRRMLADAGLTVRERHVRNLLPLFHVLFVARKPEASG